LSKAAGLSKERAVLSFLLAGAAAAGSADPLNAMEKGPTAGSLAVRIISDAFSLPGNRFGRYGCSVRGLVLTVGEKTVVEKIASGSLVDLVLKSPEQRDGKSGALIAELNM
jgi:hypothetical protein